jgi:hypothetical protein
MPDDAAAETEFPDKGILWRGYDDSTLRIIDERQRPVLLFVADRDPAVWPFLREIFKQLPFNANLRTLLHESCPALYIEADALPEQLKELGAGSRYHIAVLSPNGLTPLVVIDPISGNPAAVVDEIALVLERLLSVWC